MFANYNFNLRFSLLVRHSNFSYIKGPFVLPLFELLVHIICSFLYGILGLFLESLDILKNFPFCGMNCKYFAHYLFLFFYGAFWNQKIKYFLLYLTWSVFVWLCSFVLFTWYVKMLSLLQVFPQLLFLLLFIYFKYFNLGHIWNLF